jgi:endo-1,4-beta-xylanase
MLDRRALLALPLALVACKRGASAEPAVPAARPLKALAPFPVGVCAKSPQFDDPAWVDLATAQFSQLTPEWEMKMEYILADGLGRFRFDGPDAIAAFARHHGLRLHGHTLIWYAQGRRPSPVSTVPPSPPPSTATSPRSPDAIADRWSAGTSSMSR